VVERLVANEKVEGSNPFARSIKLEKTMSDLAEKKCTPCEGGISPFDINEIHKYLKKVNEWNVLNDKNKNFFIEKEFKFNNYTASEIFVIKVGQIAEEEGHHPDISFGWGYAKIKISTHSIKGLAESDFVLAAKIDRL
jgi:4a-hydroxytetrahydrobiopterin dehydratase